MAKRMRYKQIDQLLTRVLIADTAVFILYLIFAGICVILALLSHRAQRKAALRE